MGRGSVTFIDKNKQQCDITTQDADNLAAITAYGNAIAKYSDAEITAIQFSQAAAITAKTPGTSSNVDRKGIVICKDAKGKVHKQTIPSLKSGQIVQTSNGERLTDAVVDGVAAALTTLIGSKCTGLYGYPIQKK
jgi:hypothetical protein